MTADECTCEPCGPLEADFVGDRGYRKVKVNGSCPIHRYLLAVEGHSRTLMKRVITHPVTVMPTDHSKFTYIHNGTERREAFLANTGDLVEVRAREKLPTVPPPVEKRDRALYRLLLDLEEVAQLAEADSTKTEEQWVEWARTGAVELRQYFSKRGYSL